MHRMDREGRRRQDPGKSHFSLNESRESGEFGFWDNGGIMVTWFLKSGFRIWGDDEGLLWNLTFFKDG